MNLQFMVSDRDVEMMLERASLAVAPASLAVFLRGSATSYVQKRTRDRFASEGDDVTGKWAALEQSTQDIRTAAGYSPSHPINHRTGALEAYVAGSFGNVTTGASEASMIYPGTLPTGETMRKLRTAQEGRVNPGTPARPVLGVNERDLASVMTALGSWLDAKLMYG